jgi:hypothetical protein
MSINFVLTIVLALLVLGAAGWTVAAPDAWRGVACNALRPTGRKDPQLPIDDNPAKELQAAPL